MKVLKGIARFCYDFIVGDDWKIAAAVVTALVLAAALVASDASGTVVAIATTGALVALFSVAVVVDVRRSGG
jgi:hypothetical protein